MMIAANYETAVGSVSQCRGMSNMSVQISPKMISLVRARVHDVVVVVVEVEVVVVVMVVVVVEVNGSWVRGGERGRNRSRSRQNRYRRGEERRGQTR